MPINSSVFTRIMISVINNDSKMQRIQFINQREAFVVIYLELSFSWQSNSLEMYNFMALNTIKVLCNYSHYPSPESFHIPQLRLYNH